MNYNKFGRFAFIYIILATQQGVDAFLASYLCNMVIGQFTDQVGCGCALTWSFSGGLGVIADCDFEEDFKILTIDHEGYKLDLIGKPKFHGQYYWRGSRDTRAEFQLNDQVVSFDAPDPFPDFAVTFKFENFELDVQHKGGITIDFDSCQAKYGGEQCTKCSICPDDPTMVLLDCSNIVIAEFKEKVYIPAMTQCIEAGVIPSMYGPSDTYAPFVPYLG